MGPGYEPTGTFAGANTVTDQPLLARLSFMADYAERIADQIEHATNRFHGVGKVEGLQKTAEPPPCGHNGQLDRLQKALDRLDQLSNAVSNIM